MDSVDLLAREEEFRKLNKQLEKKTVSLMKEIESVMKKQDIFSEFSPSTIRNSYTTKQHHCDTQNTDTPKHTPVKSRPGKLKKEGPNPKTPNALEPDVDELEQDHSNAIIQCMECSRNKHESNDLQFLYAFISVNVQTKVLPESFLKERVSVESVCKFLSSKVKLFQEQTDKLQSTVDRKIAQCERHMTQVAEYEAERMKLLHQANSLKAESADMKNKVMALQKRLDEKDRLYQEQRRETDRLTNLNREYRGARASRDAQIVSQSEEIDRLKQKLTASGDAEKEFRASVRSLSASHTGAISRLEAKVKALKSTIDKQSSLIANLRQQNSILSVESSLKVLEKEYVEFLTKD